MRSDTRAIGNTAWNAWRAFVGGIIYFGAAVFNTAYTLPISDEPGTFAGYADGAWFGFLADFISDVFEPNGTLFMALVIVFEVAVGILILSRDRYVDWGVIASLGWVLAIMPFLAWPYVLVNVGLVLIQGALLLRRYDTTIWGLLRSPGGISDATQPR